MGQHPPAVRRVPALLTALAALVVLIAVLGSVGVLAAPDPAAALTMTSGAAGSKLSVADGAGAGADQTRSVAPGSDNSVSPSGAAVTTAPAGQPLADTAADAASTDPATTPTAVDAATLAVPPASGDGRRAIYSIGGQRVWLVEADGTVARTYLVSGKADEPGPGTYAVYSKSPTAISYDYTETMQHMVRFARGEQTAIGFHDIPALDDGTPVQTEAELGQPLSAGSVRQAEADAAFLWDWADVGTTVVVVA